LEGLLVRAHNPFPLVCFEFSNVVQCTHFWVEYEGKEEEFYEKSGWGQSDVDLCFIGAEEKDMKVRVRGFYESLKKSHPEVRSA